MKNETKSNSSISFLSLLFLAFLILKLCGVIDWSWWWVTAPLWGGFAILLVILAIGGFVLLISSMKREPEPTFIDRLKKTQAEQEALLKQQNKK